MSSLSELHPAPQVWTSAQKLLERAEPCDIIEIRYEKAKPPKSHFVFNIRKGWCVSVIQRAETNRRNRNGNGNGGSDMNTNTKLSGKDEEGNCFYEGFKDAVDLIGLAGRNLCRINNLDEIASTYNLQPRSRKDALQIARAGLAEGAVSAAIKSAIPGDSRNAEDVSKQFCVYWKYAGSAVVDAETCENKFLDKTIAVCGLVLVLLAAVVATSLSM